MHRIVLIALLCATLYGIVLGAHAPARADQEATPDTSRATLSPAPRDPLSLAMPTATPAPAQVAPPAPSPASGTPAPAPAEDAAPTADDTDVTGDGTEPPAEGEKEPDEPKTRTDRCAPKKSSGAKNSGKDAPSTSAEDCESRVRKRDAARRAAERAKRRAERKAERTPAAKAAPMRRADGSPSVKNPSYASATLGAAPIGVPNFFIDKFRIPPFLLPIYQAAGMEYGIRWEILAAINEIETDYGRNLNVSSAGALGWMQFMPATWKAYGVDANDDGRKDPYNPADAIFAAARYLRASGGDTDLRRAVFAYNHADWYVDSVLMRARVLGGLPADLIGSLTGLTQARFPIHAKATYAGDLKSRVTRRTRAGDNAAFAVESQASRRGIDVFSRPRAPVIAVNDGRIVGMGSSERLGRWIKLRDVYGNTFTYANLGSVSENYPVLKRKRMTRDAIARELELPRRDRRPARAASTTARTATASSKKRLAARAPREEAAATPAPAKERLFAHPSRPNVARIAQRDTTFGDDFEPIAGAVRFDARDYESRPLRKGARVVAGTVLGRLGGTRADRAPHLRFEIRPAGRGAPRIDPKPILDGWKLLETTAIYRAAGRNPFFGRDSAQPSVGQILMMSKEALMRRVTSNPRIDIYSCGERDIISGQVDRRVLASLEYLAASGLRPTVSSLKCGHGYYTAGGSVSHHSSGNALDIAAVNGIPITGHQGRGSITDITIQRLLTLQGTMKPDQIISLMTFEGTDNTFAMGDHHDHIHVGWRPLDSESAGRGSISSRAILKPRQWTDLITRLGRIENPHVRAQPSRYAVKVVRRASHAHHGE